MTTKDSKFEKQNWNENFGYRLCESLLSHSPLTASKNIGEKTSQLNFDWEGPYQVSYKVEEEWQELKEEIALGAKQKERIQEELGDLLFSLAQLARHLNIDPELALVQANRKFIQRFNNMIALIGQDNHNIKNMTEPQINTYWRLVKKSER